ncbi:hypothetical protein Pla175_14520 [Pirellulimonas nuda]|uniref:Lipocalin-like domain-containing protein n=1 Tax=Pirellulimonas nuda TaxID=2528009 RepID=A0A518D9C2_9BACT|nr:hypothetical protein [Pirellulimonas nuda]QDU88082.1 hypothetical protein Pla175_14520 [Pirellulimonas nuda]
MQRRFTRTILTLACTLTLVAPSVAAEQLSLLGMLEEWKYPDSPFSGAQMSDGATVDAAGKRTTQSIVCNAEMMTEAPIKEVVEYYQTKLSPMPKAEGDDAPPADDAGRSVVFSDDSEGRPFAVHTVLVNTHDTSTTLIISRGKDEALTHIAWKQYRRLGP